MSRPRLLSALSGGLLLLSLFLLASSNSIAQASQPLQTSDIFAKNTIVSTLLATKGCGKPSPIPAGTSADGALYSGGLVRIYRLHVPRGYLPTHRTPLVLNFHGHGSAAWKQEALSGFSGLADKQGFLVVYPQGVVGPDHQTGWATGPRKDPTVNDVGFVSNLITYLQTMFCVDPQRIYATGFSNGGAMTADLACMMAGRIAAFAPVSGSYFPLLSGCHPNRPVPILEIHGTADTVVPYEGSQPLDLPAIAEWLSGWAARDGCSSQPQVFFQQGNVTGERWANCEGGATVIHYRVAGEGHVWPGALPGGTTPQAFNATDVIWSFFHSCSLPSAGSVLYTKQ
jgi:polyhydroxybutyrate depolymerase